LSASSFNIVRDRAIDPIVGAPSTAHVNVTVCQFHDNGAALERDWEHLCEHSRAVQSELILLPDLPFYPWLARSPYYHTAVWDAAVAAHDACSTPANESDRRLAGAREVARLTHAFALSANRATDGGGWIINPDGETVALTQQAQPFVTVDLESAAIQLSAR
jgi:hypothetical protein